MKSFIIILFTVGIFSGCSAGTDVPEAVKTAFTQKFPSATDVKWEMEGKSEYEAEFKMNGAEMSASFSPDGTWMATETTIDIATLPAAVTAAIAKAYSSASIKSAEMVESASKGSYYEVDVKDGMKKFELVVSSDGSSVSKEEEEED